MAMSCGATMPRAARRKLSAGAYSLHHGARSRQQPASLLLRAHRARGGVLYRWGGAMATVILRLADGGERRLPYVR